VNLAFNKPAWQGITLDGRAASRAVDGNPGTCTKAGTPNGPAGAWLAVDLGASVRVNFIKIWNTQDTNSGRSQVKKCIDMQGMKLDINL
jgi:hypothetical protein